MIERQTEPSANGQSDSPLDIARPIPLFAPGEIQPEATDKMVPPQPQLNLNSRPPSTIIPRHYIPTRSPAVEKKALLIGIRYDHYNVGGEWGPIPRLVPNVRRVAALLESEHSLPSPVLIHSRNSPAPSRALWIYRHCYNDRRR